MAMSPTTVINWARSPSVSRWRAFAWGVALAAAFGTGLVLLYLGVSAK